jgi:hypothetical protein
MEIKTASYEAPRMETVEIEAENCILETYDSGAAGATAASYDDYDEISD